MSFEILIRYILALIPCEKVLDIFINLGLSTKTA